MKRKIRDELRLGVVLIVVFSLSLGACLPIPSSATSTTNSPSITETPGSRVSDQLYVKTPEEKINQTFDYVFNYWPKLARPGDYVSEPLPQPFAVPGDAFDWFFYWDSYFMITGLVTQGKWKLAKGMVDDLIHEVEVYGFVPNYNAPDNVCASRSQPPFLTQAIREVYPYVHDKTWLARAYNAAKQEYEGYWTSGGHITDTGLSRYYAPNGEGCLTTPDTANFRAIAESGWDNTPRFGNDAASVLPVDLNSQLYRYELDLADFADILGKPDEAQTWRDRASHRQDLINQYFWDADKGFYYDYDLRTGGFLKGVPRCVSAYVPLWAGVANQQQAKAMDSKLHLFDQFFGLATCEPGWDDNTQHNYPNGWAYSNWYVAYGLRRYGFDDDATHIAMQWLRLLADQREATGAMWERYNVVDPSQPPVGRYEVQKGFGWTNGVYAALLTRIIFGIEPDMLTGKTIWKPDLPPLWTGRSASINLPTYPWPNGTHLDCENPPQPCQ